jgi:hypothetical protein
MMPAVRVVSSSGAAGNLAVDGRRTAKRDAMSNVLQICLCTSATLCDFLLRTVEDRQGPAEA